MNKQVRIILFFAFLAMFAGAEAQTTFYLDGLGRALTSSDKLEGDVVEQQDSIVNKGVGGYQLFDLGMNLEREGGFKANFILRAKNQFGGFYGAGVSLNYRQLYLEGVIAKGIKYKIGDLDLGLSPYTVSNSYSGMTKYESDIFKDRRGILEYENFITDEDTWRLQGVDFQGKVLFEKGIDDIGFKVFAVRTNPYNQIGATDRILFGGNLDVKQSDIFSLGLNTTYFSDLEISTQQQNLTNLVLTAAPKVTLPLNDDMNVLVMGEFGTSSFKYEDVGVNQTESYGGSIVDAKVGFQHKPLEFKLTAGYKMVSKDFRSAAAQSMRYNETWDPTSSSFQATTLFSEVPVVVGGNPTASFRQANLYDRYTQENIYYRNISAQLQQFNPIYGNATPYGEATPNRQGIVVDAGIGTEEKGYEVDVKYQMLEEQEAWLTSGDETRKFSVIRAGGALYLGQLLDWDKLLTISASYNSESTTRDGANKIDLSSNLIDAGLVVEFLPNLDLLAGYKSLTSEGNEFYEHFDEFNIPMPGVTTLDIDSKQDIISAGLRFRFNENAALAANYNKVNIEGGLSAAGGALPLAYSQNQLFIHYFMKF